MGIHPGTLSTQTYRFNRRTEKGHSAVTYFSPFFIYEYEEHCSNSTAAASAFGSCSSHGVPAHSLSERLGLNSRWLRKSYKAVGLTGGI